MKDNSYRLVIRTVLDGQQTLLEFDTINPPSVRTVSHLTEQPMVTGDIISDHMYKEPVTVDISGAFSVYGNKPTIYYGANDRLTNVQDTFERIKNEGVFCTLITLSRDDNSSSRFKARHNMVLKTISWTENQSSVNFNFSFQEVMLAELNVVSPLYDVTDENLPVITDAKTLNFTDELLDMTEVNRVIIKTLCEADLINKPEEFINGAAEWAVSAKPMTSEQWDNLGGKVGAYTALGAGVGVYAGIKVLLTIAAVSSSVPVWGWIAAAAIAVASAIIGAVIGLIKGSKKKQNEAKYGIKAFTWKKNKDEKNKAEYERFAEYIGSINNQLNVLNDVVQLYGLSDDAQQSCIALIDGEYYSFTFTKNNTSRRYNLKVESMSEEVLYNKEITGVRNIGECTSSNRVMQTSSGFEVYVLNKALQVAEDTGASEEKINDINLDLKNYLIVVSSINLVDFNNTLADVVVNAMVA